MRFVDSNIAIYASSPNPDDAEKRRIARQLFNREAGNLAISVQVLGEFYAQATRPSRPWVLSHSEAMVMIERLKRLRVYPLTLETVDRAVHYRTLFSLSYWDCLILASAKLGECDAVYSEDMSAGQDYDGIRVINPFAAA